ncbi:hypothetical protein C9374_007603 [Naegleria lovaniensis]|uniref:F-box domain-containing protein n=1 Tax=Naegleria lovaniensis TaxID=51637 RepID=A0AA88GLI1_NAELO|nr:uncharacterized protein C9374_007603 [Naegleria lovaniensis]KAG2378965.1 hypothetical protein C9374_007603 [Naegleria lovaniensis]
MFLSDYEKMQQKDRMRTLEFIQKSLLDDAQKNNTRACPFCLQNIDVVQLSEHVSHCLELWNDLRTKRSAEENSDQKRKLFSRDESDYDNDEMNLNSMKKKKIFQYQYQILPNDMIRQILSFQENKFLIGVCMRVCKQWLEIVRAVPLELEFCYETLSTVQHILENQSGLCITKLDLKDMKYNDIRINTLLQNKNLDKLQTLELPRVSKEDITAILECPYMSNLKELSLNCCHNLGNYILESVCNSIHLQRLNSLILAACNITPEGLAALTTSSVTRNLTKLALDGDEFGDEGAKVLAECSSLSNLRCLKLTFEKIYDEGIRSVCENSTFENLTELDLSSNRTTDSTITCISESKYLTNIQYLSLSGTWLMDPQKSLSCFTNCQNMKNLKSLDLSLVDIFSEGAQSIAKNSIMSNLIELNLSGCQIEDEGVIGIATSEFMKNLRTLILANNEIQANGVTSLSKSPYLSRLTSLNLDDNPIGNAGATAIASSFAKLTNLNISECGIGNDGLKAICNSTTLTNLVKLVLCQSPAITNWEILACSSNLSNLSALELDGNDIGIADVLLILKHLRNLTSLHVQQSTIPLHETVIEMIQEWYPNCEIFAFCSKMFKPFCL